MQDYYPAFKQMRDAMLEPYREFYGTKFGEAVKQVQDASFDNCHKVLERSLDMYELYVKQVNNSLKTYREIFNKSLATETETTEA